MRKNQSAIIAGIVGVVVAVFIVLLATSETQRSTTANFEILGEVAPQFAGTTLAGEQFDLREERGDWIIVNFFASWCVGCRIEHPELVEFDRRHQNDGVQVGDWPALVADTGSIAIDYGVTAPPETVLISPSGRIVQKWVGASGVTADAMDATIAQLSGDG